MKLQLAIDLLSTQDALNLLAKVHDSIDIIELGTPLIKQEGLAVVTAIKKAYPDKIVFADMKTMDAGALEAGMAFKAGADQVSILAVADNSTIKGAVEAANKVGKEIVADAIGVKDKAARSRELKSLGVHQVEMHAGLDEQAQPGYSIDKLLEAGREAGIRFSVAGGVNAERISHVEDSGAAVAVAGAAIYGAADPAEAARSLRSKIQKLG